MKTAIILGKGTLAIRAAQWMREGHDYVLKAVVPVMPEPEWTDSLYAWGRTVGTPVIWSGDYREAPNADVALSIFYDKILSAEWIDKYGRVLNLHNGALPRYRGVNPINWALRNGDTSAGVTLHEVTPGIDDGPILAQTLFPIWPGIDDVRQAYARATRFGWELLRAALPLLDVLPAEAQDEALASYYSKEDAHMLGNYAGWTK